MKTIKWLSILTCLACAVGRSDPLTILRTSATNKAGVKVYFETRIEPTGTASEAQALVGGVIAGTTIHRWIGQGSQKRYLGYDVQIEPSDMLDEFRLNILPLSVSMEKRWLNGLWPNSPEEWTGIALPSYPPPQTVRLGDALALDLLVNPYTGQKVVDYLFIGGEPQRRKTARGPAHDFAAADAELVLNKPRVTINGELVEATRTVEGSASGHIVSIYLGGHGRIRLSLVPRVLPRSSAPVFQRAGEIRGSTLTFHLDSDTYDINCEGRIAPGPGAYHLYVSHEPAYQQTHLKSDFSMGAESLHEKFLH